MLARRIIDSQLLLLSLSTGSPTKYTVYDYGYPKEEIHEGPQRVHTGNLPSIKMSHSTIVQTRPKPGPNTIPSATTVLFYGYSSCTVAGHFVSRRTHLIFLTFLFLLLLWGCCSS